jgi:hypothetical protein
MKYMLLIGAFLEAGVIITHGSSAAAGYRNHDAIGDNYSNRSFRCVLYIK